MVIATQNPVEFEGTYPLPESQLDRFLLRIPLGYPDRGVDLQVLFEPPRRRAGGFAGAGGRLWPGGGQLQAAVRRVEVEPSINEYLLDIVHATRRCGELHVGASTRGGLALSSCRPSGGTGDRPPIRRARRRETTGRARARPLRDPEGLPARRSARGGRIAYPAAGERGGATFARRKRHLWTDGVPCFAFKPPSPAKAGSTWRSC